MSYPFICQLFMHIRPLLSSPPITVIKNSTRYEIYIIIYNSFSQYFVIFDYNTVASNSSVALQNFVIKIKMVLFLKNNNDS